jgi:putative ABC transport system permease protein
MSPKEQNRDSSPPRWPDKLVKVFCAPHLIEEVMGDLHERYSLKVQRLGEAKARRQYWREVLAYMRPYIFKHKKPRYTKPLFSDMLRNNVNLALRNLKRRKAYAFINVLGLAMGIACAILIFTLVKYHLGFDTFHTQADRIYRITTELQMEGVTYNEGVPSPLGEALRNEYTFAEKVASVASFSERIVSVPASEDYRKFKEDIAFAEPAFFDMLDFPLVRGNEHTILNKPNTAIITERIAIKYFGDEDPMGQTIRIDNVLDVVITGILRDLPVNTDRRQEIYLPFSNLKDHSPWLVEEDWWLSVNKAMQCFVLLKPSVSTAVVEGALIAISDKYYDEENAKIFQFKLQPLSDIHFNADLGGHVERKNLWALSLIGLFLIVTACVNFINLATAQALGRSKEVGVRKVLGGLRRQVFWQFITETALITLLGMGLAMGMAQFALPYVNQLLDVQLSFHVFQDAYLPEFLSLLLVIVTFFSGSYPGAVLAGFQPVLALKGKITQRHIGGFSLRRGLVVTQFAISQVLIIGTIVIANQMRFVEQADMGFEKDAIVMLPVPVNEKSRISTLGSHLSQIAGVEEVTFCNGAPASEITPSTRIQFDSRTEAENFQISFKAGDHNYVPTFELQILEGRNLQPSDTIREFLLNETAVNKLGLSSNQDAIGKTATINGRKGTIIGVVKDFHNKSFHAAIDPVYITTLSDNYAHCAVKINLASLNPTLTSLEEAWRKVYPDKVYEYDFLDKRIAQFYKQDMTILRLIYVFAGIAIVIGCLGLYGLVSFMAAQKTKEVGVRKVLGASVQRIVWLFGKEFTYLLVSAFVIAAPLAWWTVRNWLDNFTYRIEIRIEVFVLAIALTFLVAIVTVGYQALKAALANPVNSLRNE